MGRMGKDYHNRFARGGSDTSVSTTPQMHLQRFYGLPLGQIIMSTQFGARRHADQVKGLALCRQSYAGFDLRRIEPCWAIADE